MRTVLVVLFLVIYCILNLPVLGVEYLLHKNHAHAVDEHRLHSIQWAFRAIKFLSGTKVVVKGHEKVPMDEPVLYIGNHRGFYDIVASYAICPDLTGYIAKDSLGKIPMFGWIMRRNHCLFLVREDPKESLRVILKAIDYIKEGVSIAIYPEGGRNKDDLPETSLLPFKDGSFKPASRTGCPVVPVATIGSRNVLENHFPWIRSATITVLYGDPVRLKDLPKEIQKHPGAYFQGIIHDMIAEELAAQQE